LLSKRQSDPVLAQITFILERVKLNFHFTTPGKLVKQAYPVVAGSVSR